MGFKRFSIKLVTRTIFITLNIFLLSYLLLILGYYAAATLACLVLIWQCFELVSFISKTNTELTRFLDAARYADFSQRFHFEKQGAGFEELGDVFSDILNRFNQSRTNQEQDLRHLRALIEHVPVPLLSVFQDKKITLWNNSARRLFGQGSYTKLDDLTLFGNGFIKELTSIKAGERRLVTIEIDNMEQQLTIAATQIIISGRQELLISLQDIQTELDGAQLKAWQDLVRVLTHEIMNSVTPIASLAKTSADLVNDAQSKIQDHPDVVEELEDVADAVQTVARRSDGLMAFVSNYRKLTRLPLPDKKRILLSDLFNEITPLANQNWQSKHISFECKIEPERLELSIDQALITQVLINILQNAEHALEGIDSPKISIHTYLNKRGRIVIDVSDNGCGMSQELIDKAFVPFFTTKRDGSGVGLAFTRQVMLAHGGKVKLSNIETGGTIISLMF